MDAITYRNAHGQGSETQQWLQKQMMSLTPFAIPQALLCVREYMVGWKRNGC